MIDSIWKVINNTKVSDAKAVLKELAKNREIDDIEKFINPPFPADATELNVKPAVEYIRKAISDGRAIIIHGDYDADGQTATAILWRTIYNDLDYKNVHPYIPNRFDEGYGLSKESIKSIAKTHDGKKNPLIITVDCGITAVEESKFAIDMGFSVIITDHHEPGGEIPEVDFVVHTTKSTGAGIAWLLSNELLNEKNGNSKNKKYLDLAAIGTICDLQPLKGFNRSIAYHGLIEINKNPIEGIKALKELAGIKNDLDTYEIGWIIGPRLNATGRLEDAMESLRLLSTDSPQQAKELATNLNNINAKRQDKTQLDLKMAMAEFYAIEELPHVLVTTREEYHEGVIGLVAGRLTQTFYRPSIAISTEKNSKLAKGSARSIKGISIIETLRRFEHLFENLGGHDMAAGFSILESNIDKLKSALNSITDFNQNLFTKELTIDLELPTSLISNDTLEEINKLKPFGVENYEPVFLTKNLKIYNLMTFGQENNHLKLFLQDENQNQFTCLAFGKGKQSETLKTNDIIDVAYSLSVNTWNGNSNLELRIRDFKKN